MLFAVVLMASAIRLFIPFDADGRPELSVVGGALVIAIGLSSGALAGVLLVAVAIRLVWQIRAEDAAAAKSVAALVEP